MTTKNKLALALLGFIFVIAAAMRLVEVFDTAPGYINFNGKTYPVLMATTMDEQVKGLSDRTGLGRYAGMYFYFGEPGTYTMVMRDMLFSLDMVWLRNNRVVDLRVNLLPENGRSEQGLTRYFNTSGSADAVLELPAGTVRRWGIRQGDMIRVCEGNKDCFK